MEEEGRWVLRQAETNEARSDPAPADSPERVYANLYLIALGSGNAPALDAFLSEVPEELRERVFEFLDRELANRAGPPPPLPAVSARPEATPLPEGIQRIDAPPDRLPRERMVRSLGLLVPGWLRDEFLGSLVARRHAMRSGGATAGRLFRLTAAELAKGVAQWAPLAWPPEAGGVLRAEDRATLVGRAAWRLSGPLLLAGHLFGTGLLLLLGVAGVGTALGCVLRATMAKGWEESAARVRLVNGVLGSLVVVLAAALLLALPAGALLLGSGLLGLGWPAAAAVHLFVVGLLGTAALLSASGWAPAPWTTRHLVRVLLP